MKYLHFLIICLTLGFISCEYKTESSDSSDNHSTKKNQLLGTLPKAKGRPGDVLIAVDSTVWPLIENTIEKAFSENLAEGPYISDEPKMSFIHEDPRTMNKQRKLHRNYLRIILDTTKNYDITEENVQLNMRSAGQVYIVVSDSDVDRLNGFLEFNLKAYIDLFNEKESDRVMDQLKSDYNKTFNLAAREKFGVDIYVPASANFKINSDTLLYALKKQVDESTQNNPKTGAKGGEYWSQVGIMIWKTPYLGEESMKAETIMTVRDSVLRERVKGTVKGSYMTTEYYPTHKPTLTYFNVDGNKAVKIEGLWKQSGNPAARGGGPFAQISIVNQNRQTVVHINTYVFAPRFDKREYIREIRGILSTISILD